MIDYVYTDEQLAAEDEIIARFHALRRSNSSRRERQEAWAAADAITTARHLRRVFAHPIKPTYQWTTFHRSEYHEGWLYPGFRSIEPDEVRAYFPGALEAFGLHCADVRPYRFIVDPWCSAAPRLRVSQPMTGKSNRMVWMPEVGVWRRYTCSVKSRPHRVLEAA